MYDYQTPVNSSTPFDGDTFRAKEYDHWIRTTRTYSSIRLYADDIHLVRQKVLGYARRRGHVLETEKISETILKITFTGKL
jgi:hypothetical protein